MMSFSYRDIVWHYAGYKKPTVKYETEDEGVMVPKSPQWRDKACLCSGLE